MITVHLPAHLRRKLGRRFIEVAPGTHRTLRELLTTLAEQVDPRFTDLAARGTVGNSWISSVVLNDRRLQLPEDAEVRLSDGDRVFFIQPIAGGWESWTDE